MSVGETIEVTKESWMIPSVWMDAMKQFDDA